MPETGFLSWLVPWATAGLGAGGGFFFVKWLLETVFARWDKKEAAIDAGMKSLLEGLQEQVATLKTDVADLRERLRIAEGDLADCKQMHAEAEAEKLRLAALLQGSGDARQLAQLVIAAERAGEGPA